MTSNQMTRQDVIAALDALDSARIIDDKYVASSIAYASIKGARTIVATCERDVWTWEPVAISLLGGCK